VSAHAFRRHPRAGRAALLLFGAVVLPVLALEAILRIAPAFIDRDRGGALGAGAKRVVCIGDSNTFGVYYPASVSYPGRLQVKLDAALGSGRFSVVQAGRPGRPTAEMRSLLPELLARVRPDFVVVLGGINDRWNHVFSSAPIQFLADHSRLFKALRVWLATRSRARLDEDRPGSADPMAGALTIDDATLRERVGANLRAIAGAVRENGATPFFLTYPASGSAFDPVSDAIRSAAAATSTRLIDLTALFAREQASRNEPLIIPDDGHPYPAGYELMARAVAEALLEELSGAPPTTQAALSEAIPVARPIELALAADSPSALLVTAAPHRSFHIVISRTRAPRLRLRRCDLDLGDDEIVRLSSKIPSLRGVTDDAGRARVDLPKDALRSFEPGPDGLRAAALLLDPRMPERANVRIWAVACSDVVLLRPAASPAQPEK
jgi:lysophospholipase L1-like esterase